MRDSKGAWRPMRLGSEVPTVGAGAILCLGALAWTGCGVEPEGTEAVLAVDPGPAAEASPWDVPPISIAGWSEVDAIREHYPESLEESGGSAFVLLRVCIDSQGTVQSATVERGARLEIDRAAMRAVEEWRYLPAFRYTRGLEAGSVEALAACHNQGVWFYPEQLEKSPKTHPRIGYTFVLDGRLVKLYKDGYVVRVDDPRASIDGARVGETALRLTPDEVKEIRWVGPAEARERYAVEVKKGIYAITTKS